MYIVEPLNYASVHLASTTTISSRKYWQLGKAFFNMQNIVRTTKTEIYKFCLGASY